MELGVLFRYCSPSNPWCVHVPRCPSAVINSGCLSNCCILSAWTWIVIQLLINKHFFLALVIIWSSFFHFGAWSEISIQVCMFIYWNGATWFSLWLFNWMFAFFRSLMIIEIKYMQYSCIVLCFDVPEGRINSNLQIWKLNEKISSTGNQMMWRPSKQLNSMRLKTW